MRRKDLNAKDCYRTYAYGVTHRTGRTKPWLVKFTRNKRTIYVGVFRHYSEAIAAATAYITQESLAHANV